MKNGFTLKHNNSSECVSHPGGQGALESMKCLGSWKSLSLWMLSLHSDKALKVLQFFTSHRPKAGPPDITTQPLPLTEMKKSKGEDKKTWKDVHNYLSVTPKRRTGFISVGTARYLVGVCSSLCR